LEAALTINALIAASLECYFELNSVDVSDTRGAIPALFQRNPRAAMALEEALTLSPTEHCAKPRVLTDLVESLLGPELEQSESWFSGTSTVSPQGRSLEPLGVREPVARIPVSRGQFGADGKEKLTAAAIQSYRAQQGIDVVSVSDAHA
jgi:hypothetical protein